MARTDFKSVSEYIAAQPASVRPALASVRATIRKALPKASEGISYQIPVYKVDGTMVLYFAGYARHYSIYPATASLVRALELDDFLHNRATLRFSVAEPVPARLIARVAKFRATEAAAGKRVKVARKGGSKKKAPKKAKRRKNVSDAR